MEKVNDVSFGKLSMKIEKNIPLIIAQRPLGSLALGGWRGPRVTPAIDVCSFKGAAREQGCGTSSLLQSFPLSLPFLPLPSIPYLSILFHPDLSPILYFSYIILLFSIPFLFIFLNFSFCPSFILFDLLFKLHQIQHGIGTVLVLHIPIIFSVSLYSFPPSLLHLSGNEYWRQEQPDETLSSSLMKQRVQKGVSQVQECGHIRNLMLGNV